MIDFNKIQKTDIVYIGFNSDSPKILKHHYIGIFTEPETNKTKHVFLGSYFHSVVSINVGEEKLSHMNDKIFNSEIEAKQYFKLI